MDNELYHFNPYHDKSGRFTSSGGAGSGSVISRAKSIVSKSSKSKQKQNDEQKEDPDRQKRRERKIEKIMDKKNRGILSNEDLGAKIERLKKEQELKKLTSEDVHPVATGIKNVLSKSGEKAVTTAATGAMLYITKVAVGGRSTYNRKDFAEAIFNGGPKKK